MKTKEIIIALEEAKSQGIPMTQREYHNTSNGAYCTIGWLFNMIDPLGYARGVTRTEDIVVEHYGFGNRFDLTPIYQMNDNEWETWDDAIAWFKELEVKDEV